MDYEKKYKEAFERAKQWCNAPNVDKIPTFANRVIKEIFPELKESEDDRIRKSLIILLQHFYKGYRVPGLNFSVSYKDMLTWLENQGEQKTTNKVEPKFKVGDWITNGATKPAQISSIEDDMYYTHNGTIGGDIESMDKDYHLWTIADAKDGDVLVTSDKSLFIYDGSINEDGYVGFHIAFAEDMGIILTSDDGCGWEEKDSCHPATKEQRDSLMKAIADAGYTFDFEKKKLKKNSKSFADGGCKAKIEAEQNLAWSEEDENAVSVLRHIIKQSEKIDSNIYTKPVKEKLFDWLKSLKERLKGE